MKPINTIPVEAFLERVRVAVRTNQRTVNIDVRDAQILSDSLVTMLARLVGDLSNQQLTPELPNIQISADGGSFKD